MAGKTWFITGTSRGFGREWAVAALDRGDQVTATARDVTSLDDLAAKYGDAILPLGLDVTDRDAGFAAVKLAHDCFGRLDVTVYDAGCGQFGMVEEISEAEIGAQLETNLLGALWVTRRPGRDPRGGADAGRQPEPAAALVPGRGSAPG
jgi:NAD(P)-dependent dehydrogenase (short-subunit alcohol dehydrogenase family)